VRVTPGRETVVLRTPWPGRPSCRAPAWSRGPRACSSPNADRVARPPRLRPVFCTNNALTPSRSPGSEPLPLIRVSGSIVGHFGSAQSSPRSPGRLCGQACLPLAADGSTRDTSRGSAAGSEDVAAPAGGAGKASDSCARCGEPLPTGLRKEARVCSKRCRQAASRARLKHRLPFPPEKELEERANAQLQRQRHRSRPARAIAGEVPARAAADRVSERSARGPPPHSIRSNYGAPCASARMRRPGIRVTICG